MLKVSASHVAADWRLDGQAFAVVEQGEYAQHRIGGDAANGYYASAPRFGCGRTARTIDAALTDLLLANGCTSIRIDAA